MNSMYWDGYGIHSRLGVSAYGHSRVKAKQLEAIEAFVSGKDTLSACQWAMANP